MKLGGCPVNCTRVPRVFEGLSMPLLSCNPAEVVKVRYLREPQNTPSLALVGGVVTMRGQSSSRMFWRCKVKTKLRLVLMGLLLVAMVLGCSSPGGTVIDTAQADAATQSVMGGVMMMFNSQ